MRYLLMTPPLPADAVRFYAPSTPLPIMRSMGRLDGRNLVKRYNWTQRLAPLIYLAANQAINASSNFRTAAALGSLTMLTTT
ncbi:hypothetical protein GCM10027288_15030 [Bordetella tumbae]